MKKISIFIMSALIAVVGGFSMKNTSAIGNGLYMSVPTISVSLKDEKEVKLLSGDMLYVTENYTKGIVKNYANGENLYAPTDVKITWEAVEGVQYYTFHISLNSDMSDATDYVTVKNCITIDNLFAAKKYYYRVIAVYADKVVKSQIFEFKTANLPRTIWVDGVSNTRDIGGYFTEDGKHQVKQGMVYRGALADAITEVGKDTLINKLGVKTDLDLRGWTNAVSPIDDSLNFVNVSAPFYVANSGIQTSSFREALLTEITTFANKDNYPIYVHCQAGRDRTGTIVFLINALLGVSETDLLMDYEITFMSVTGYKNADFDTYTKYFDSLLNYIKNYATGTLSENCEKFMLNIGVSQTEIDSIRTIMLEKV